jgi:hypothetical protein
VIALLDRSNFVQTFKLYICCGVFAALGMEFGTSPVNGSKESALRVAIVATLIAYALSKVPIRLRRE